MSTVRAFSRIFVLAKVLYSSINKCAKCGFMTDHGFCRIRIRSETTPPLQIIAEIAGKISEVKGVIWAHVVKRVEGEESDYDIIFEFGHPRKRGWNNLGDLLQAIESIKVKEHGISPPTDVWIIQSSYKG